jgi:hypothetical protein
MRKNKKSRRMIAIIFSAVVIAIGAIVFFREYNALQLETKSKISYVDSIVHQDFNSRIADAKEEYSKKIDKLLNQDDVKKAFAQRDRKKLFRLVEQTYKKYKSEDSFLKIMTFRLVDGSTFLRVHKPQMYGDKLNKNRTIILDVARLKTRLFGFEIGKLKMSYRIVTPIFYNKKYVGLVEVGISTNKFTKGISELYNIKNALVVKTKDTKISLSKGNYTQEGNFSLVTGEPMFKDIFKESYTQFKNEKSFEYTQIGKDKHYLVVNNLHLLNQNNKIVAKILLAYDMTSFQESYEHFKMVSLISGLSVGVMLLIVGSLLW